MDEIKKLMNKTMLNTYVFNLVLGLVLVIITALFSNQGVLAKLAFGISVAYCGLFLSLYGGKAALLQKFYKTLETEDTTQLKVVENSVLLNKSLVSFSFNIPVLIQYKDITLVRNEDNVFEKARPGYKGNHKIYIKAQDKEALIPVSDGQIANKILNFLQTQNSSIQFQNKTTEFEETELSSLDNYKVSGRF